MPKISGTELVRVKKWQLAVGLVLLGIGFAFHQGMIDLVKVWLNKADYSHGFLIPPFAGYLLWRRRHQLPEKIESWPNRYGVVFFVVALALYVFAQKTNYVKETFSGIAIIIALSGVLYMFLGAVQGLKWAWLGLVFLLFALPLPNFLEIELSWRLRLFAAKVATYVFQIMGFPTYTAGTVIHMETTSIGIEEACSGLSMLLTFIALSAGIAVLCPPARPTQDRIFILLSSIPIAVICNIGRIVVTGLVYYAGWKDFGDLVVHDLAGWLMMPVALGMIWLEFKLLDWIFVQVEYATTDEVARVIFQDAAEKALLLGQATMPGSSATSKDDDFITLKQTFPESPK